MALSRLKLLVVVLALLLGTCIGLGQAGELGGSANAVSRGGPGTGFRRGPTYASGLPLAVLTRAARRSSAGVVPQGVRRQVPQEYATIQGAIDSSADGDTVLVSEGTYFENIRYRGKAITVASLYLIDGDMTHIERTIIDGSKSSNVDSGSVVYFVSGEDTNSILCGLTIRGGSGTRHFYEYPAGGVWYLLGGGIYCDGSGPRVTGNIVTNNSCVGRLAGGGGIKAFSLLPDTYMILEGNRIVNNRVWGDSGAGWAIKGGGASVRVSARILNNLFEGNSATGPSVAGGGLVFAQMNPGTVGPLPSGIISGNIFRRDSCNASSSARGGGLSVEYAKEAKIQENQFLHNNVHSAAGYGGGGGAYFNHGHITAGGNLFLENISTGGADANGGAIVGTLAALRLEGNIFTRNSSSSSGPFENAGGGGAMFLIPDAVGAGQLVANNFFSGNTSRGGGGAIFTWDLSEGKAPLFIVNNTIVENSSGWDGGGIHFGNSVDVVLMNNIIWGNRSSGVYHQISSYSSVGHFLNNDIMGGWTLGSGNVDVAPGFGAGTYRLSDSSFCIGAGLDSVFIDSVWYRAPDRDIDGSPRPNPQGSHADLGAYENSLPISTAAAALSVTPRVCDFHNVRPGSVSDTIRLAVINRDTISRQVLSLSPLKMGISFCPVPLLPVSIPPQSQTEFKLVCSPAGPGETIVDTLVIETTDRYYATKTVVLRGRGSDSVRCAQSGALYAISGTSGVPTMHEIDRQTGRVRTSEEVSPQAPQGVRALTARRRDSMLYAAFPSSSGTDLYRISSQFGDFEPFGTIPLADITSMAFSPADVLYLVTAGTKMYRAAGGTADTVFVGSTGHAFTGLAFSPATGLLWASIRDSMFTVDPATGVASLVGWSDWQAPRSSIAFSPLGTLYGVFGTWLVMIERVWAMPTELAQTGEADLVAIAMRSDPATEAVEDIVDLPQETSLFQNYPNPFNPTTIIRYVIGESMPDARDASIGGGAGSVRLAVYDILGREVALLVEERKAPGSYEISFDASGFSSGVYFYRLQCGTFARTRRMVLMK